MSVCVCVLIVGQWVMYGRVCVSVLYPCWSVTTRMSSMAARLPLEQAHEAAGRLLRERRAGAQRRRLSALLRHVVAQLLLHLVLDQLVHVHLGDRMRCMH